MIIDLMQYLNTNPTQPNTYSLTLTIISKTIIALTRIILFALNIHYNQFNLSALTLNLILPITLFIIISVVIYYRRFGCTWPNQQYHLSLTIAAHLYGLANSVLAGVTVNLKDHEPREFFFQIFFGQMVNYMLTLIVLHQLFTIYLVKNSQDFLKIFQPVQKSMVYLFVAYSIGILCDLIAFAQTALIELYIFIAIALIYLIARSIFIDNLKNHIKRLFAQ